jgi:hypothetical protein
MTGVPLSRAWASGDSLIVRFGLFSVTADSNRTPIEGHYFYTDGQTLFWTETYGQSETKITQASWNIDIFDGNGASGLTVDTSTLLTDMLFVIDQEWLGAGRVRVGFNINGVNYYAHQFTHTTAYSYTTTPRLPIVYQITGTTVSSNIETRQNCSTCISESGFIPTGVRHSFGTSVDGVSMSSADVKYVLLGLRINSSYTDSILKPVGIYLLYPSASASKWAKIEVHLFSTNGTIGVLNATPSFTQISESTSEFAVGDGSTHYVTTDGYVAHVFYLSSSDSNHTISTEAYETLFTNAQISQYDTLYVVATTNSTNQVVTGAVDFIEAG